MISTSFSRKSLQLGISSAALLIGLGATPAFAQVGSQTPADSTQAAGANGAQTPSSVAIQGQREENTAQTSAQDQAQGDVVVTGSLFRGTAETPSPVTSLTAANLDQRGINTVTEAIQRLSANGAGTLPNSFSANGAFASGASAPSLRGLTTNSTLVLFDGLRAAYYPLADDGSRNFVDTNTIPIAIVDRVDVLRDGASSTYGADAVAGVINIITKKQITGLRVNGSAGLSQKGDAAEKRIDATYGYGDLSEKGFNVYVSGEYQRNDALFARDRGYPYNTSDLSRLCGTSLINNQTTCRTNSVANGPQFDGTIASTGTTLYPIVRPYNAANSAGIAGSRFQLLNAAQGCGALPTVQLNPAQAALLTTGALTNCQQDNRFLYGTISPTIERIGGSARATVQINDNTQAYAAFNFYQSDVFYTGTPATLRANSVAGGTQYTTGSIALPVYVCPRNGANATFGANSIPTVPGCTAANGTLNPNNPFAALGQTARIQGLFQGIPLSNERKTRTYRVAAGVNGSFGNGFDYSVEGTYMRQNLRATYNGYPLVQNLFNAIADGSYNFVNQNANSQAVRDYVAPSFVNNSKSELAQVQVTLRKQFFDLPGGPLGVAIGGSFRYESVFAPSANPVNTTNPYNRYFTINGFGTSGSRGVGSGFFEVNAPILDMLTLNGSGRYDSYSSGQTNFSPKIGGKFTPVKQISLVSTFSKGFRIPSFAESFGTPTTGYVSQTPPTAYQNSPSCFLPGSTTARYAYCTAAYSVGLTSIGNPDLRPEKSTNFTAGLILNPVRNVSFRVDYYNIYKKDLITGADYGPQINAYYASGGNAAVLTPNIIRVTQDANYIAGQGPYALLNTVEYNFINANSQKSTGIDFNLETSFQVTPWLKWTSSLDATRVLELSQTIDGVKQRYEDTLGPYQTTSASGTPLWRGSWQNTFDFGRLSLTGTAYYTSGYSEGAADDGNVPDGQACYSPFATSGPESNLGSYQLYRDGATVVRCRVKHFISIDLSGQVKINDQFTLYGNVLNVLDVSPPYDPSTYGAGSGANAGNYNPAWANSGIIGRYFRVGARVKF